MPVHPDDQPKNAFSISRRLYESKAIAFGLANALSTFQRLMEYDLAGLQWQEGLIYLDDVIAFANSVDQHFHGLRSV